MWGQEVEVALRSSRISGLEKLGSREKWRSAIVEVAMPCTLDLYSSLYQPLGMSISLRLARRSVAGFGIRSSSPRLLSTLYTPRRPGLSLPSSISAASPNVFLTQRRNISDGGSGAASAASEAAASAASAAPQATASTADIVSNLGTSPFFETVWQAAKSIVLFPTNMVTEALVNIPTPSYVLSVFVLAYVLRTTLTFPMQIWQRKRVERLHRFVHPHLDGINERIALETMVEAKRDGWPYEKYIETVRKKVSIAASQT